MRCRNLLGLILSMYLVAGCTPQTVYETSEVAPAASPVSAHKDAWDSGAIVSAANPHAVAAAVEMLKNGGHAVDAAIAAHAVLGLVEPQSSGLGGGAFMLVYGHADGDLKFLDGRESAPAGATVDMFMQDGEPMDRVSAWQSGLSVGVPGTIALYKAAHDEYGTLAWADLFQPAIQLADQGFEVSPRMAYFVERIAAMSRLDENPDTAAYFYPDGKPLAAGHLLKNPEYAATLRQVAAEGISAFYTGALAEEIAKAAQAAPNGGSLTVEDIENYEVIERPVICGGFRTMDICTSSPPSSGAAQILLAGIYDHLIHEHSSSEDRIAAFVDAQRLAYADRDHYFGDPKSVDIPLDDLLSPTYIEHRATERFAPAAIPTHGDPGSVLNKKQSPTCLAPTKQMKHPARRTCRLSTATAMRSP